MPGPSPAPGSPTSPDEALQVAPRSALASIERVVLIGAIAVGAIARFMPRGPLWLDEALSVNIASEPIGNIAGRLKVDGHPPLYYFLLHLWQSAGVAGNWWPRALSGVVSLLGLPLAWIVGRQLGRRTGLGPRLAWYLAALYAVMPYGIRYASETRMYSLIIVLVMGGIALVDELYTRAAAGRSILVVRIGLVLVTGALLWTHYWSMWLIGCVGLGAIMGAWRARGTDRQAAHLGLITSLIAGGLTFLPWVSTLMYQSAHTGTPWGKVFRPAAIVAATLTDFSGGTLAESQVLAYSLVALVAVAIGGHWMSRERSLRLGAPARPAALVHFALFSATLAIGWAVAFASGATFASRYAAVVYPSFVILVAIGIVVFDRPARYVAAAIVIGFSCLGIAYEIGSPRSQSGAAADAIRAQHLTDPLVVACPDQLAVAAGRALGADTKVVAFPDLNRDTRFVDWVDYGKRNAAADPAKFAQDVLTMAGKRPIVLIINLTYKTLETQCATVAGVLQTARPAQALVTGDGAAYFESMSVFLLPPR